MESIKKVPPNKVLRNTLYTIARVTRPSNRGAWKKAQQEHVGDAEKKNANEQQGRR